MPAPCIRADHCSTLPDLLTCSQVRPCTADHQDGPNERAAFQLCLVPAIPQLADQPNAAEGYQLQVSAGDGVRIAALTRAGLFYGVQSALQLLPPIPPAADSGDSGMSVPAVLVRHRRICCCTRVIGELTMGIEW